MREEIKFLRLVLAMLILQFHTRLNPFFFAYCNYLAYDLFRSFNNSLACIVILLMGGSACLFHALDTCAQCSRQHCPNACLETVIVGVLHVTTLCAIHIGIVPRELVYTD